MKTLSERFYTLNLSTRIILILILIIYFITPIIIYDINKTYYKSDDHRLQIWINWSKINRYILIILLIIHIIINQITLNNDKVDIYALLYLLWSWNYSDIN